MSDFENDLRRQRHWHLDKRVPIALIAALLLQTFGAIWWASSITSRVDSLEHRMEAAAPLASRMTRVEVKLEDVQSTMKTGFDQIKQLINAKGH